MCHFIPLVTQDGCERKKKDLSEALHEGRASLAVAILDFLGRKEAGMKGHETCMNGKGSRVGFHCQTRLFALQMFHG